MLTLLLDLFGWQKRLDALLTMAPANDADGQETPPWPR